MILHTCLFLAYSTLIGFAVTDLSKQYADLVKSVIR